jgi:hypothetical protein
LSVARTLVVAPSGSAAPTLAATCASSATLMNKTSASSTRLPDACMRMVSLLIGCSGSSDASALIGSATKKVGFMS